MKRLLDSSRFIGLPKNRYDALDEVQSFMRLSGVDLGQAFEVLLNSNDGYLSYVFGDVEIQFVRGFGVWSENPNAVQMSIELENDRTKETVVYEYEIRDLMLIRREEQLKDLRWK